MQIQFVLVQPQRPENVGAAARALKTMGFGPPRLVQPCDHLAPEARWLAHGSEELLTGAEVFASLDDALEDVDLVVGTTAKLRQSHAHLYTPETLRGALAAKPDALTRVALLLGREDSGLSNEILDRCDLLTGVPLAVAYPSLNLAQAVMVYAYALSGLAPARRADVPMQDETAQLHSARQRVTALLERVSAEPVLHGWVRERLPLLEGRDLRLLHSLLSRLDNYHTRSEQRDD